MERPFQPIDLSQLEPPPIVEALDYEQILAEMLADLRLRDPEFDALVESDPAYKVLEAAAFRELLLRQRINEAARALLLATAPGAMLDHLAALYGEGRLPGESDESLRSRAQTFLERFSAAGPYGAYEYFAKGARVPLMGPFQPGDPTALGVGDLRITNPIPGTVAIIVLGAYVDHYPGAAPAPRYNWQVTAPGGGDTWLTRASFSSPSWGGSGGDFGLPAQTSPFTEAILDQLSAQDIRPLCDTVEVVNPTFLSFSLVIDVTIGFGPAAGEMLHALSQALDNFLVTSRRFGRDITHSALAAALHLPGVHSVDFGAFEDVIVPDLVVANCTAATITITGRAE